MVRLLARTYRTSTGAEYEDAHTQLVIMACIMGRIYPRIQLILPTQYGKSDSVAKGLLPRVSTKNEPWAIISSNREKADIIMGYLIQHIFDDDMFQRELIFDEPMEKLKQHRSKDRLTFKNGGEVRIYSADAKNTQRTKEALMGFGAPNVILDESALIPDDLYATIKRMVGGHKDNFLLEIGNPFTRGHFLRTWIGGRYERIYLDYRGALAEGRYSEDFIEEMREEAFFDVLYECKFPDEDEIRSDGYRRLVINATLENAYVNEIPEIVDIRDEEGNVILDPEGNPIKDKGILGYDVAAGGENESVGVVRYPQSMFARVVERNRIDDLDDQADVVVARAREYEIGDYRTGIDDGGVGQGVSDSLKNHHEILFKRVNNGETPHREAERLGRKLTITQKRDRAKFANTKAMMNWRARQWLKAGGKLVYDKGFEEAKNVYYKQNPSNKLQMEPKEELRKRGILSPDTWDAFVNTFIDVESITEDDDIDID